jgi:hypothetical protein
MERAAGFAHDDTPKAKLDKLDALLARTSTSIADAALFADMLSLPDDGRYPAPPVIPQQRREATLQALIPQIETLARSDSRADDLRGCALGRSHEPGSARARGEPGRRPSRASDRDVPAGIRTALDRTTARHRRRPRSADAC